MKQTRSNGGLIAIAVIGLVVMFGVPHVLQLYTIINLTPAIGLALLGLSLGLVWGYGGILCFGQTAFFGIGAYVYAIAAQNFGETAGAIVIAIAAGAALLAIGAGTALVLMSGSSEPEPWGGTLGHELHP